RRGIPRGFVHAGVAFTGLSIRRIPWRPFRTARAPTALRETREAKAFHASRTRRGASLVTDINGTYEEHSYMSSAWRGLL
ncbi:MAG TPA: hypothetical protein VGE05_02570, partial [Novosphingobium sp.]